MNPGVMANPNPRFGANYDTNPIGTVIQSPLNLEVITKGKYIALDGRDCLRAQYPEISPYFPAGVFKSTAVTLNTAPYAATIATNGTVFVAGGGAARHSQNSTDGITWSDYDMSGTITTGYVQSVIYAGSRFVFLCSSTDSPAVSATGTSGASLTTGGSSSLLIQGLAYSPTANGGAGRTIMCKDGSQTTANGLFYMNDGSTAWTPCSGGSTRTRTCIVWTGQRFIAFCTDSYSQIQTSSDGVTWVDGTVTATTSGVNSAASNGNGTVIAINGSGNAYGAFIISNDHGITWRTVIPPRDGCEGADNGAIGNISGRLSYANGKFFFTSNNTQPVLVSVDGLTWQVEPMNILRGGGYAALQVMGYKNGTYCALATNTAALTFTEDMSKFKLPSSFHTNPQYYNPARNEYMKVKSY